MNPELLLRLAYFSVRQAFPKPRYIILRKPKFTSIEIDQAFSRILSPNPYFTSDFLVIDLDESKTRAHSNKLTNVWVKFADIQDENLGEFISDSTPSPYYEGRYTLSKHFWHNLLDDNSLFANIKLDDSSVAIGSVSKLIFIAVSTSKDCLMISKPFDSKDFVKVSRDYHAIVDTLTKEQKASDMHGLIRPISFTPAYEALFNKPIIEPESLKKAFIESGNTKLWWRLGGHRTAKDFTPFKLENTIQKVANIPLGILNSGVAVTACPTVADKKKLNYFIYDQSTLLAIQEKYKEVKSNHDALDPVTRYKKRVSWLLHNYPELVLYPAYHWHSGKPFYYQFKHPLNKAH